MSEITLQASLTFDKPLVVGPFAPGTLTVQGSVNDYTDVATRVPPGAPTTVTWTLVVAGPPTGPPNRVTYSPPPFHLVGQNGLDVVAFVFP